MNFLVSALMLVVAPLQLAAVLGTANFEGDHSDLDSFVRAKMAEAHIPSMAVLVQHNETALFSGAYGYANPFSKPALNASVTSTPYTMASVSKTVMSTTLMLLYDQGLFKLDDDVNHYLQRYPKAGFSVRNPGFPTEAITFRQLLTHTSSVSDQSYDNIPDPVLYKRGRDSPVSLRDLLYAYFSPKGKYYHPKKCFHENKKPGDKYDYSNVGASLLGYMVEVLTGTDFAKWSTANVLEPLGMSLDSNSWLLDPPLNKSTVALPTRWKKKKGEIEPYCIYGTADYPDGGFHATAAGLARHQAMFMQFGKLGNTQLLKEETVVEMRRQQTLPGLTRANQTQGLIWYYEKQAGRELLGHDGSDFGVATQYFFNPRTNIGVVLLTNGDWDQDGKDAYSDAVDAINIKLFDRFEKGLAVVNERSQAEERSVDGRAARQHARRSRKSRNSRPELPPGHADLCDF